MFHSIIIATYITSKIKLKDMFESILSLRSYIIETLPSIDEVPPTESGSHIKDVVASPSLAIKPNEDISVDSQKGMTMNMSVPAKNGDSFK